MKYTRTKTQSGVRILPNEKKEGTFKAIVDYTVTGKAEHNGTTIPLNEGISVEVDVPLSLIEEADSKAEAQLNEKYKND